MSVVPFLFGVAMRSRLPGTVLVRLLIDVGATESAARSALARLRSDGALTGHRRGRTTDYELAGLVGEAFLRARAVGNPDRVAPRPAGTHLDRRVPRTAVRGARGPAVPP